MISSPRRIAGIAACAALALAACTAPPPPGPAPAAAHPAAAEARATPLSAVERYYPEVLRAGIPENFVIVFVVSAGGRVVRHETLNTMPGSGGIQVERLLEPYGLGLASLNVIRKKPGEMGPHAVSIAWAELNYEPVEPAAP
jgi:hypothetical protein